MQKETFFTMQFLDMTMTSPGLRWTNGEALYTIKIRYQIYPTSLRKETLARVSMAHSTLRCPIRLWCL